MRRLAGITAMLIAGAALAGAPDSSLRPVVRPQQEAPSATPGSAPDQSLRPKLRSGGAAALAAKLAAQEKPRKAAPSAAGGVAAAGMTPREQGAVPPKGGKHLGNGMMRLCRDRKLIGKEVAPVKSAVSGCGIPKDAIQLYEVNGIKLSTPALVNCDLARSLSLWIEKGMEPSVKRYKGGVVELKVAASYACRPRNNRKGARISEHGRGNAIDISEFRLKKGEVISVRRDWGRGKKGRILKNMHKNACGPFGTVLGPNADRYHKDHFHFDVARYRSGPYCR